MHPKTLTGCALAALVQLTALRAEPAPATPLQIGGVYPHLTAYQYYEKEPVYRTEAGIGALVPWAGKLWYMTYAASARLGSEHKLYSVEPDLSRTVRKESVGGTPAARMIHRESNQLFIGPYVIDAAGKVRVIPPKEMPGRLTAVARHLSDPANKVYYYGMEGELYEVDVNTLKVTPLYTDPLPGWHGKGAYTGQGRLVLANNGEHTRHEKRDHWKVSLPPNDQPEGAGILAEWDGKEFRILERRQFTDITSPGDIYGAPDDKAPLWAIGWDKRSLRLKLLENGEWSTYLLPKAALNNDAKHGWFTEWPRIRDIGGGRWMMDMHGMFFDFPKTFSRASSGGLTPISTHLRFTTDFCEWNGQLVISENGSSVQGNELLGQSQSGLWFGQFDDLKTWGPNSAYGGPWVNDPVKAGVPTDPFLTKGFDHALLHLATQSTSPVSVKIEVDEAGTGQWTLWKTVSVDRYTTVPFPADFRPQWTRLTADQDAVMSAQFHLTAKGRAPSAADAKLFAGLADIGATDALNSYVVALPALSRDLAVLTLGERFAPAELYHFSKQDFTFSPAPAGANEVTLQAHSKPLPVKLDEHLLPKYAITVDAASVIVTVGSTRYRLPKGDPAFDALHENKVLRSIREVVSERVLSDIHGTFYELPLDHISRPPRWDLVRPVASHRKQIVDFASWNGLLVLTGVKPDAQPDGRVWKSADGKAALWFGGIDDLWRLGKPVGRGGPWKNTAVKANQPSDAYLMTGYEKKRLELTADKPVNVRWEVDFDRTGSWQAGGTLAVKPGEPTFFTFPEGYSAHWVRLVSDANATVTAEFIYE